MKTIDIPQINVTKENCDYYFEITAGVEHINIWLRKKNAFDYWVVNYENEETDISYDKVKEYIKANFDRLVEELTGEKVPEGEINSENIFAGFQWMSQDGIQDDDGFYVEMLKEYTISGYIFWPWIGKENSADVRVPGDSATPCNFAYEIKEWEFPHMKERYLKKGGVYKRNPVMQKG